MPYTVSSLTKFEKDEQKIAICSLLTNCIRTEEILDALLNDPKEPMIDFFSQDNPKILINPLINASSLVGLSNKVAKKYGKLCMKIVNSTLLEKIEYSIPAYKLAFNLINSTELEEPYEICLELGSALLQNVSSSEILELSSDEDCLTILQILDKTIDGCPAVAELCNSHELPIVLQSIFAKREGNKDITELCNFLSAKLLSLS